MPWSSTASRWLQILRDPSSFLIAGVLPLLLLFIFGFGVTLDLRRVPVGVVVEQPTPEADSFLASSRIEPMPSSKTPSSGRLRLVGPVAAINPDEVRRYLGYPKGVRASARVEEVLGRWIAEGRPAGGAAGGLPRPPRRRPRQAPGTGGRARGPVEFTGSIGKFLGPVAWLAVFLATAGPDVERLAADLLRQGDRLAGLIVNAVGAERAEAAEFAVLAELTALAGPAGLGLTLPYSPGYGGMALAEQRKVIAALDGGGLVGVSLTPDCLMAPLKSVSGLIGLGRADLVARHGSPCDRCDLHNCATRR
jgi:hypothetical protein